MKQKMMKGRILEMIGKYQDENYNDARCPNFEIFEVADINTFLEQNKLFVADGRNI